MKISHIIFFSLVSVCGCARWEQQQETIVSAKVVDITTGDLQKEVSVSLLEIETPATPFSNISISEIERETIKIGETFEFIFNAKRGNRFEYILQFNRDQGSYSSGSVIVRDDSTYETAYEMVESCTLSKKNMNECLLTIEPTCTLSLQVLNIPPGQPNDSIWVDMSDGHLHIFQSYNGTYHSPTSVLEVPHGHYQFNYWVYNNGIEQYSNSYPVELKHNRDTSIVVEF